MLNFRDQMITGVFSDLRWHTLVHALYGAPIDTPTMMISLIGMGSNPTAVGMMDYYTKMMCKYCQRRHEKHNIDLGEGRGKGWIGIREN